jgi:hypothetical protein
MDTPQQEHHPGDIILDRYMLNASEEEREIARENLRRLARLLIRVHERLTLDNPEDAIRTNADSKLESELLPSNV